MKVWLPYSSASRAESALGGFPAGIEVDVFNADGQYPDSIADVEYIVAPYMGPAAPVMERVAEMKSLKYIQLLSAGYENFLPFLTPGLTLLNAAGVHDASTAELAVSLALASGRHLDNYARNMTTGTWDMQFGVSLADKHCLIVGYGRIGKAIEARLAGFEVASITRVASRARTEDGLEIHAIAELPKLLPNAEVVFVITPLTEATKHLFSTAEFAAMPENALLVNVARGAVVDTDALVAATESGHIRAALDVTDPEPLPVDHRLWKIPNVFISPHCGGQSTAFYPRSRKLMAEQLRRLAAGEELLNKVAVG